MGLHLTSEELEYIKDVDENCSKHIVVVNDIYSWEKEREKSMTGHMEGSRLCSSVQVMSNTANVSVEAAKRIPWVMCREWEAHHKQPVASKLNVRPEVITYCRGLESLMAGNELWSKTTKRYNS